MIRFTKKLTMAAGVLCCALYSFAYEHAIGGYTYNYTIIDGKGADIRPIFNTSSHNTSPAVNPALTGDCVMPLRLPDHTGTNSVPVVNIGYQPNSGRYSGTGCAFSSRTMTSIVLADTVTNIALTAFAECTELVSVTFPKYLTSLGIYSFAGCSKLTRVELPAGFQYLGQGAFSGCTSIVEVVLRDGLLHIGDHAFSSAFVNDFGLTWAHFTVCTSLESITIPSSTTNVGWYAFSECSGLKSANVGGGAIGGSAFSGCIALSSVTLGENVTSIGDSAFFGCTNMTELVVPDSVTSIGASAFRDCTKLTRIILGNGVRIIGDCNPRQRDDHWRLCVL